MAHDQRILEFPSAKQVVRAETVTINNNPNPTDLFALIQKIQDPPNGEKKTNGSKWANTDTQKLMFSKIAKIIGKSESEIIDIALDVLFKIVLLAKDDRKLVFDLVKSLQQKNLDFQGTL